MGLPGNRRHNEEVFRSPTPPLSPHPELARLIVEDNWFTPRAAKRCDVSWRTAKKRAERYREGIAETRECSSIPRHQPNRTPAW